MSKAIFVALIVVGLFVAVPAANACPGDDSGWAYGTIPGATVADPGDSDTYVLVIKGMTCATGCVGRIKDHLGELDGVERVDVHFESRLATVRVKSGTELSREACAAALGEDTQYEITSFIPVWKGRVPGDSSN